MYSQDSGYLVEFEDGRKGRTYHKDELINGRQPVYLMKTDNGTDNVARLQFTGEKTLVKTTDYNIVGFID